MRVSKQLDHRSAVATGRSGAWKTIAIVAVCLATVVGVSATVWALQSVDHNAPVSDLDAIDAPKAPGKSGEMLPDQSTASASQGREFPVSIHKASGPPRVATGIVDPHGNSVTVACSTCHTTREPDSSNKTVADLGEFHRGMKFSHGNISCLSCHNSSDYDALKLADGTRVEFENVMTLCAQCHGAQMKDYEHGAHGGMNGYWDRTRGPQQKNNCVDCHRPHAPQFPKMQPTFKPKDRFLNEQKAAH